jgi:long-chain acyl-CoA synthetase
MTTMLDTLTRQRQDDAPPSVITGSTIVAVFRDAARARPDAPALRTRDEEGWRAITWREYEQAVAEVACGLRKLGLEPGDRAGILSGNRPEWHVADMGMLAAGTVSVPVYQTSSSSQVAHVLADSGSRVCFVEDGTQLSKILLRRHELPALERVVVMGPLEGADDGFVITLGDLRDLGATALAEDPGRADELVGHVEPDDIATIVYTSGTTGPPKGAVITHANIMATLRSLITVVQLRPTDRFLSFLPLSHITERSVSHFGQVAAGGETWFARSIGTVPDDLRACRPTLFFAVPRVWEKFRDGVVEAAEGAPVPLRQLIGRYLDLVQERAAGGEEWGTPVQRTTFAALDSSIGRLLRRRLGLDQSRLLASGAAPIHPDLLRWFAAAGLTIAEGYGQTEVSLCSTLNPPDAIRIGTVGRAIPGVEIRIADDGEILVRGGNVCAGYWQRPDATAELIDPDGWLHTGDLGALDPDGYLRVTGRKKDLIITAYGKNISPSSLETALRNEHLISQAVVVGDNRAYLTALIAVDLDAAAEWAAHTGRSRALGATGLGSLAEDEAFRAEIEAAVNRVNAVHSHAEGIRKWRLLPRDLTMDAGELTPTLKVRRDVVVREFADLVAEMYADTGEAPPS